MVKLIVRDDIEFNSSTLLDEPFSSENSIDNIGFMARALVQATLPHSKIDGNEFQRKNGLFTLTILAPSDVGLPYGSIPRLLMAWIATEAVKTKSRDLILGRTLSEFMAELDIIPTGGRWGTITRLKDQLKRLLSSSISCSYNNEEDTWAIKSVHPISQANLWWHPTELNQQSFFESTLTLSEEFFHEVTTNPIPIDLNVLKALKRSPMAIDIYCWLTYRMSYLHKTTLISWRALQTQFGSGYATDYQGTRNFKKAFVRELCKVLHFYTTPYLEQRKNGLLLQPSNPHILPRKLKSHF